MQAIARRAAAPIFAVALFSSAALIFVLQPLFARMVTPQLGGSPAVWNTSMAFFQAALLVGYLYAHLLARVKDLRIQAAVHGVVLVLAWLVLPVHVSTLMGPPSSEHPALWLVGVLTVSVGAPFAAASATAPLLQSWYARTGRADAGDPYYLYAASNLGSFGGLLAYPIIIEPLLGAHAQSAAWSAAYILVAALIVMSAATAIAADGPAPQPMAHTSGPPTWRQRLFWVAAAAVPSTLSLGVTLHISTDVASAPLLWVIPLAIYLATFVLAFMKNNEGMYRATLLIHPFAVALMILSYFFARNWVWSIGGILGGFFFSALVCHLVLSRSRPGADRLTEFYLFVSLGGVLGGAFAAFLAPFIFNNVYEYPLALAAACLFRPRADSDMPRLANASLGAGVMMGVLALALMRLASLDATIAFAAIGGALALLAAGWGNPDARPPVMRYAFLVIAAIHSALVIYVAFNLGTTFAQSIDNTGTAHLDAVQPWSGLMIVTSLLVLGFAVHGTIQPNRINDRLSDFALGAAIPTLILLILVNVMGHKLDANKMTVIGIAFCAIGLVLNRTRPYALAALVALAFLSIFLDDARGVRTITQERSFFGVLRTRVLDDPNDPRVPPLRILMHGTTIHGAQLAAPGLTRQPLTYYHPRTALGEAILAGLSTGEHSNLALIGLGAGSTACLTRPTDTMTIFEIDPAVVRLSARPHGDFTYVTECQPNAQVRLGDARLQIAQVPDNTFDVIVVDAFSSDAIPAHLLTREAIALYLRKTTDRGIVVLHLSNRNLALVSESARVARDLHVPTLYRVSDRFDQPYASFYGGLAASVMIVAKSPQILAMLPLRNKSDWREIIAPPGRGWSDDYINLPRALWESRFSNTEECLIYPYVRGCPPQRTHTGG